MSFKESFDMVEIHKDGKVKCVSKETLDQYIRDGWKKKKEVDLNGKRDR